MEIVLFSQKHNAEALKMLFQNKIIDQKIEIKEKITDGKRDLNTIVALIAENTDLISDLVDIAISVWEIYKNARIVLKDLDGKQYELPTNAKPEQISAYKAEIKGKNITQLGLFE